MRLLQYHVFSITQCTLSDYLFDFCFVISHIFILRLVHINISNKKVV